MKLVDGLVLQELKPYEINLKFKALRDIINGGIDNENVPEGAEIDVRKTKLIRVAAVFDANNYNLNDKNVYVGVTTTPAPQTIVIQTAVIVEGASWIIKDESGTCGANPITISAQGAVTIDGQPNVVLNFDYDSVTLYCISQQKIVII